MAGSLIILVVGFRAWCGVNCDEMILFELLCGGCM
jgi:hypothetical protein